MSMAFLFVKPRHGSSATAPATSRRATVTFLSKSQVLVANQMSSATGPVTPYFVDKPGDAHASVPAAMLSHAATVLASQAGYSSAFARPGSTWATPPFQALYYRQVVAAKKPRGTLTLCSATPINGGSIEDEPPYLKLFTEEAIQGDNFVAQNLAAARIPLSLAREKVLEVLRSQSNGPGEDNTRIKSFYQNIIIALGIALNDANGLGVKIAGVEHLVVAVAQRRTFRDVIAMVGGIQTSSLLAIATHETNWQAERKYLELEKMMRYLVERSPEWRNDRFKFKTGGDGEDK